MHSFECVGSLITIFLYDDKLVSPATAVCCCKIVQDMQYFALVCIVVYAYKVLMIRVYFFREASSEPRELKFKFFGGLLKLISTRTKTHTFSWVWGGVEFLKNVLTFLVYNTQYISETVGSPL